METLGRSSRWAASGLNERYRLGRLVITSMCDPAGNRVVYRQGVGAYRPAASVSGLSRKPLVAVVRTSHHSHSVASHLEADRPSSPPDAEIGPHFGRICVIDHDCVVCSSAPLP